MAERPEHGHLREPRETGRQRQLARAGTLLDRRAEAYARTLRPKLVVRRLHADDPRWLHRDGGPGPGALPWSP